MLPLICIPLSFYFQFQRLCHCEVPNTEAVMTLAKSPKLYPLLLPVFSASLEEEDASKAFLGSQVCALANASAETHMLIYLGVLFHGICYDFLFTATSTSVLQMMRSAAQGFSLLLSSRYVYWWSLTGGGKTTDCRRRARLTAMWYFPAIMSAVVLAVFGFFNERLLKKDNQSYRFSKVSKHSFCFGVFSCPYCISNFARVSPAIGMLSCFSKKYQRIWIGKFRSVGLKS